MVMTNVDACATGDFTKCVGAPVCYIDSEGEEHSTAYPILLLIRPERHQRPRRDALRADPHRR